MAVKTRIVRIGNSQGIRIPKPLLEQSGISDEVELVVQDDRIIIQAAAQGREGWEQAFAAMSQNKDDVLLDSNIVSSPWDDLDRQW